MTTAGLLLAAGAGSRLGRPKASLEWHGRTLAQHGVAALAEGGCSPVLVVLGAVLLDVPGAVVVVAADWAAGMSATLRAGLAALPAAVESVVVALADQPLITAAAVARLVAADGPAAVATYGGRQRNPVRLARQVWADVGASATGDSGARDWLRTHAGLVTEVVCDDVASPDDIDTEADYARLIRLSSPVA